MGVLEMTQTVWDEWRARQLARTDDPQTSRAAALHMVTSGQLSKDQSLALSYIRANSGCIAAEVEAGTKPGIWKRINELERAGLVVLKGERINPATGRMQRKIYAL